MEIQIKKCNKCSILLNDENKVKNANQCKSCRNKYERDARAKKRLEKEANPVVIINKCSKCSVVMIRENKKSYTVCKTCQSNQQKDYRSRNKEKVIESRKKYYEKNKEKISEYYQEHYKINKDTYMENNRKWRQENRDEINKKANKRFQTNISARLKKNCRSRIWAAIKGHSLCSMKLIDCTIPFFKEWLKSNFKDGMTFQNYGSYWHVDHVIPCSKFDMKDETDITNCFRWTNLQPLEAKLNMSKHDNIIKEEVTEHYLKVKKFATLHNTIVDNFDYSKFI